MGVRGLSNFLKGICPDAIINRVIHNYSGKTMCIDVSIYLYKFVKTGLDPVVKFEKMIKLFHQAKITPIFVFDGEATDDKKIARNHRIKQKKMSEKRIMELTKNIKYAKVLKMQKSPMMRRRRKNRLMKQTNPGIEETIINTTTTTTDNVVAVVPPIPKDVFFKQYGPLSFFDISKKVVEFEEKLTRKKIQNRVPTENDNRRLKELFDRYECDHRQSDTEADHLIAQLYREQAIYGVFSEDMDMLAFGIERLVRNLSTEPSTVLNEYILPDILQSMSVDHDRFVDLCILCGTDYVKKIRGIGIKTAYGLIKNEQYSPHEKDLKWFINGVKGAEWKSGKKKYVIPEGWAEQRARARDIFINHMFII